MTGPLSLSACSGPAPPAQGARSGRGPLRDRTTVDGVGATWPARRAADFCIFVFVPSQHFSIYDMAGPLAASRGVEFRKHGVDGAGRRASSSRKDCCTFFCPSQHLRHDGSVGSLKGVEFRGNMASMAVGTKPAVRHARTSAARALRCAARPAMW